MNRKNKKTSQDPTSSFESIGKEHLEKFETLLFEHLKAMQMKHFTETELIDFYLIPKKLQKALSAALLALVEKGIVTFEEGRYRKATSKKQKSHSLSGILSLMPSGFGFVSVTNSKHQDVFIPKPFINHAMDGDEVAIEVSSMTGRNGKGPEGKIVEILKRKRETVVGVVVENTNRSLSVRAALHGESELLVIPKSKGNSVEVGDWILMKLIGGTKKLSCEYLSKIGSIYNPLIDNQVTKEEFMLPTFFDEATIKEVNQFPKQIEVKDHPERVDLTELETFTIDPKTAKDYDDALSIEKTKKGYILYVHIADVSYYVKKGGRIDIEANKRKNSVYLIGECIPMLPPLLADNLCSLKEKVNRLTVTVKIELDSEGIVKNYTIFRSIIRSQKRFTYEEAFEVIENRKKSRHKKSLDLMVELTHLLKKQKALRGSIDLSLPENRWDLADDGVPTGFTVVEYDISHQLVEEFMLKANELVATELLKRDVPSIYRIHEPPAEETLQEFYQEVERYGFVLHKQPTQEDIQKVFQQIRNTPLATQLSIRYIRSMRLAYYSENNLGHYGLMIDTYTHFTSPIRRYADLIVHRALFSDGYLKEEIVNLAKEASDQERLAMRAEQSLLNLKKIRYLERCFEKNSDKTYLAIITKIKPFGISFDIPEIGMGGELHISKLGDDYFQFVKESEVLLGKRTGFLFQVGKLVKMRIEAVNLLMNQIDWTLFKNQSGSK